MEAKYKELSKSPYQYADMGYRFSQRFHNNGQCPKDYGTGELYTSVEVHTVSLIEDNPGITATEIAERSVRTKGAVSQVLSRLEEKGLIRKEKDSNNGRLSRLFVTPLGLELSYKHKHYDEQRMGRLLEQWISLFGEEAVEKFYMIMEHYVNNTGKRRETDEKANSQSQKQE